MTINNGIVKKYFSGIVVNVQAKIEQMNSGPLMANTDLLLKRSVYLPQILRNRKFITWLTIDSPMMKDMLSPSLFNM